MMAAMPDAHAATERGAALTASDIRAIRSLAEQDRAGEVDDSYARTGDALDTIRRWYAAARSAGDSDLIKLIDRVGASAAAQAYAAARGTEDRRGAQHTRRGIGATVHARKKAALARGPARRRGPPAAGGESFSSTRAGISAQDIRYFRGFLSRASDPQVHGIYEKERRAGREEYAELAAAEAAHRGLSLDDHYAHARRRSPAELEHDIATVLGARRYRA